MFIRSKVVKGQTYYQLVEAYREAGRPRQRSLASLGPHPTIEAARAAALAQYRAAQDEVGRRQALDRAGRLNDLARRWHAEKGTVYQSDAALRAATAEQAQREAEKQEQARREAWARREAQEQEQAKREAAERERARREAAEREWARAWEELLATLPRLSLQASPEIEQAMRRLELWPTREAIQSAYRRKAKEVHTDHHGGSDRPMIELTAARDRLLDLVS